MQEKSKENKGLRRFVALSQINLGFLKTSRNKKLVSIVLVALSVVMVYFLQFNFSTDFASAKVIEYKTDPINSEGLIAGVKKSFAPKKVLQSEDGRISFYFQNISEEKSQEVTQSVTEAYTIDEVKEYETMEVLDSNLEYRYMNILVLSVPALAVFIFLAFKQGLSLVQLGKVYASIFLSMLFEVIVFLGVLSLLGLVGLQVSFNIVYAGLFLIFLSLLMKFLLLKSVQEKMKIGARNFAELFTEAIENNRSLLLSLIILVYVVVIPLAFVVEEIRSALLMIILNILIIIYSLFILMPDLLDIRITKPNGDNRPKSRKSK